MSYTINPRFDYDNIQDEFSCKEAYDLWQTLAKLDITDPAGIIKLVTYEHYFDGDSVAIREQDVFFTPMRYDGDAEITP
jgi:predicted NAD/FAD-binding protein